ncbi:MAG: hypothetical protein Q7T82_10435, partial [Armatimonadota bacterium]|nr:hypothetical protein [Armatimonadota bacterium]
EESSIAQAPGSASQLDVAAIREKILRKLRMTSAGRPQNKRSVNKSGYATLVWRLRTLEPYNPFPSSSTGFGEEA